MPMSWAPSRNVVMILVLTALAGCSSTGGNVGPTHSETSAMPTQATMQPVQSPLSGQWVAVMAPTGSVCADLSNAKWTLVSVASLTVAVGQELAVALIVPEGDVSSVFPWAAPSASDPAVLQDQDTVCPGPMPREPFRTFVFRAVKPGTAKVRAALAPEWASPSPCRWASGCPVLEPFLLDVTVPES